MKLGSELDIGPGLVRMQLTGITRDSAFIDYSYGECTIGYQLQMDQWIKLNKTIKVKLVRCRKTKAVFGFDAPLTVKLVRKKKEPSDGTINGQTSPQNTSPTSTSTTSPST